MAITPPEVGSQWQVRNENGTATYEIVRIDPSVDPSYYYALRLVSSTGMHAKANLGHVMHVELAWFSRREVRRRATT